MLWILTYHIYDYSFTLGVFDTSDLAKQMASDALNDIKWEGYRATIDHKSYLSLTTVGHNTIDWKAWESFANS